jgi:hypothetical protein
VLTLHQKLGKPIPEPVKAEDLQSSVSGVARKVAASKNPFIGLKYIFLFMSKMVSF